MSNTECRKIAVIGLPQSGKSSLSHALQELADKQQQAMQFVEIHDPDELHGHAYDVVLQSGLHTIRRIAYAHAAFHR